MGEFIFEKKIKDVLAQAKEAFHEPHPHWLLPHDVIEVLETMLVCLHDSKALLGAAGALGRIATDDYAFSESPLGGKLLDLVTEIVSRYDPRFHRGSDEG